MAVLMLAVSCGPSSGVLSSQSPTETPLAPMIVADLGADILVQDIDEAQCRLDFVQELGGYIAAVGVENDNGTEWTTIELRVPHAYTGRVVDNLRDEIGEVTYINAFSGDASVRYARLQRELAALEGSLGELSGAELAETRDRIEVLHKIIAFQLERKAFLYVTVRLAESR